MSRKPESANPGGQRSRSGWVLVGFLIIAGFFLFSEHQARLLGVLPFLLLLLCPLLHLFHGHGGHGGLGERGHDRPEDKP